MVFPSIMSRNEISEGVLFGMGNPLLDISCHADQQILDKYGMKPNDAVIAEARHMPLYEDIQQRYQVSYVAGGATQNSLRATQWVLRRRPDVCTFFGCVGADETSVTLGRAARADGVNVVYQVNDTEPTGRCAVVVTSEGRCRSLCAHLAAANCFTTAHLDVQANWQLVQKARFFYVSGFFLTVSVESILRVAQYACAEGRPFMMNFSAPFLCQFYYEQMMRVFPYVDVIFGNETEAAAFSEASGFKTTDLHQVALRASVLQKFNTQRSRMVIITNGENDVIVAADGKVQTFSVPKVDNILDTNGAGDAFVGGFLAQYIQNRPLEVCIKCGTYVAQLVIQREGCTFPELCEFEE